MGTRPIQLAHACPMPCIHLLTRSQGIIPHLVPTALALEEDPSRQWVGAHGPQPWETEGAFPEMGGGGNHRVPFQVGVEKEGGPDGRGVGACQVCGGQGA